MKYSIEPRDKIYVKGYGFMSFAKKVSKRLSHIYHMAKNFLIVLQNLQQM